VIEAGMVRKLVDFLLSSNSAIQTPALRCIGNLVTGDDEQTQQVVNTGVLTSLNSLLSSERKGVRKEACWAISNITAGTSVQIQAVLDAGIFPRLVALLSVGDFDIQKEAAWTISNATSGATAKQIQFMVANHLIEPLIELMNSPDAQMIMVAMEATENILKMGESSSKDGTNYYADLFDECGGCDMLEEVENHDNQEVYEKALSILVTYFTTEDDDENVTPNLNANSFQFGVNSSAAQGGFIF